MRDAGLSDRFLVFVSDTGTIKAGRQKEEDGGRV